MEFWDLWICPSSIETENGIKWRLIFYDQPLTSIGIVGAVFRRPVPERGLQVASVFPLLRRVDLRVGWVELAVHRDLVF